MKRKLDGNQDNNLSEQEKWTFPQRFRKRYGRKWDEAVGIIVISPPSIGANTNHRPAEEFSMLVNDQPAEAVCKQFDDSIKQLLYRAYSGDEKVAQLLIAKFGKVMADLNKRQEIKRFSQPSFMPGQFPLKAVPAKRPLLELKVDSRKLLPLEQTKKTGPGTYWLDLAMSAYEVCELNRHMVPLFLSWAAGSQTKTRSTKCWDKTIETTFYHLANGHDVIAVSDWQVDCMELPAEINGDSFAAWWNVISKSAIEYWHNQIAKYEEALRETGRNDLTEFAKRKLAIKRLGKAFKIIVGLDRAKVDASS